MENGGVKVQKQKPRLTRVRPAITTSDYRIPINEFQQFYEAIITDDTQTVKDILKSQTDPLQLLNSEFDFQHEATDKSRRVKRLTLPFHIAVCARSTRVAELFIQSGVDYRGCDYYDCNVLHSLITWVAYTLNAREDDACTMIPWLVETLGTETMYMFSRQENKDGLRPVEYAAQQNTLKLMMTLLETQGLHTVGAVTKGDTHFLELDVTEYETSERHCKSPFNMLAYLDREKLKDPNTAKVLLSPIFQGWMSAKMRVDAIPLSFLGLYRLFGLIVYFILDSNTNMISDFYGENATQLLCEDLTYINIDLTGSSILCSCLLLAILYYLTIEVILYVRDRKWALFKQKCNLFGKKSFLSNALFFKIVEYLFVVFIFALAVLFYVTVVYGPTAASVLLFDVIRLAMPLVCIWVLLYPVQVVPYLGAFIVNVQGMIGDMLKFLLLFGIFLFPFVHALQTFVLSNSQQGCVQEFSSPFLTVYTLFKMMLNMVDLTQFDITNIGVLYVTHVFFVFTVAVLLLNFLVAIMANSASHIADNEKVILMVDQISVLNELERASFWARRWVYDCCNKLGFSVSDGRVVLRYEKCRMQEMLMQMACQENLSS